MSREPIHSNQAPDAIGPYSQAMRCGDTVYLSGQIPLDPATGTLIEGDFEAQVQRVFDNLAAVCEAAGGSLADIVKLQIYLTDLSHFATVNELMEARLEKPFPARAALGVSQLPKGAQVEMDGVMVLAD